MTADARRTEQEDSRRTLPSEGPVLARTGLVAAGVLGALLLLFATTLTVIRIEVGTVAEVVGVDTALSGWQRHGTALVLLAVAALVMLLGAWRGAKPAMVAVTALGVAGLLLALVQDLPDADEVGRVGTLYADARAGVGPGFWAELTGSLLLVGSGLGLLLRGGRRPARRRSARSVPGEQRPADDAPEA